MQASVFMMRHPLKAKWMYRPVNASINGASIIMNRLTVLAIHKSVTGGNESGQLTNQFMNQPSEPSTTNPFINQPSELSTNPFINQPRELSVINEWRKDTGIFIRR